MNFFQSTADTIDTLNDWVGKSVAWLTFGCVLVCFTVVILRYVFSIGFIWLQELYVWEHAVVFMLGSGYTYLHNGHVKVDIFYNKFSPRGQAWVEIFGVLVFLFPWLCILIWTSVPFMLSSWRVLEPSHQANGLPGYFLLKSTIWIFAFLIGLQGISKICRSILFLKNHSQ